MTLDIFKQLNPAQKQAVNMTEGPVMVIAGPGTGKTQLLALRVAHILQSTDAAPQNILCLTYTEVGARNMRDRLTQLVGQASYDVRISTYHGFGSELIRQHSEFFNEYGGEQPIDKIGQIKILREIYKNLPASNPLWRQDVYLKDTLQFIGECKKALLMPEDIRTVALANQHYISEATTILQSHLPVFPRINKEVAGHFIELMPLLADVPADKQLPDGVVPLGNLLLLDLAKSVELFNDTGKTTGLTAFKNKWFQKNKTNNWTIVGEREANKLLGAADIYEQYLSMLQAKQLFDYDDMIYRAIKGLQNNDDLRFSLHEQFLYIMLDEFQDTNRAQLKLVELLTNNPVLEGRPNILAVGDDDQAIYSFQGAELSNMVAFTRMYQDVQVITLTENYRSHGHILSISHNIATTIEERLSQQLNKGTKQLTAKNASLPDATIERRQFKSDVAQFDWAAKQILKLIQQGTPPQEIAVLAPKHKYLEPLIPFLAAQRIPIRYDRRENVLDNSHVLELSNMAELVLAISTQNYALANSLWPSVLSADFWQIPTSSIWQLSWQNYGKKAQSQPFGDWLTLMLQDDTLKPIALFFAKLSQIQNNETLESMLDYLVGIQQINLNEPGLSTYTSPYYEYYFGKKSQENSANDFINTLSDLTVLRQHLREYRKDSEQALQLQDMLDFISDYKTANEKLLNTSPYHTATDAVQLMTAHSAKGLEFDVVFLLATQDDAWGMKDRSPNNNVGLPANLIQIRHAGSTKDERKRLFYVALTRAKHSLYLTGYDHNYAGKATQPLEFLDEVDGEALVLPKKYQAIKIDNTETPTVESLERFWTTRHSIAIQEPKMRDLLLPRLQSFQLSATHLNTFTDLTYGGPENFLLKTVLKFPQAPSGDGQYGNAIHETLESMQLTLRRTGELPTIDQAVEIFKSRLRTKILSETDFKRLQGRGSDVLNQFIPWWLPNFHPNTQTEYNFRNEGSFVGTAHLTGNLDQIVVNKKAKTIQIIDFKTGKSHTRWAKDVKSHRYKQQLIFYKLLAENSHSFKGYHVSEAKLVFVEPDAHTGDFSELPIVFNQDEVHKTKQLITAIWHCATNLVIPNTANYSADLKGVLAFEDWLIENYSSL